MAEPKPLASLTSGLLARKGAAQPAMRRPILGFGRAQASIYQDDLGWNDMGEERPAPVASGTDFGTASASTPMTASVPPVVREREALAERIAADAKPTRPSATASGRKAAFTLRLDPQRHFKLRLACAIDGRSAQQIVTEALDQFINGLPEIDRMAQQLPRDGSK